MKRFVIVIFMGLMMCFWMTSCYTMQNVPLSSQELRELFIGKTKQEIIQMMGPPTRETTDGGDGSILVYEYSIGSNTTTKTSYNQYDNTKREQSSTNYVNEYAWFYFDSENVCVRMKNNHFTKQERTYNLGMTIGVVATTLLLGLTAIGLIFMPGV